MVFASGVAILLFALVVFDDRFRQQLSATASGASDVMGVGRQINELALVAAVIVSQFAREQVGEYGMHMAVFTTGAVVLVIFLSRL